jgi:signal transduction histidine kinase
MAAIVATPFQMNDGGGFGHRRMAPLWGRIDGKECWLDERHGRTLAPPHWRERIAREALQEGACPLRPLFDQAATGLDGSTGVSGHAVATAGGMDAENPPEAYAARVPFRTVLASIAGLWLCYFLLTTLRWELLGLGFSREMLWPRALASLGGAAITVLLWLVLRLFEARPLWAKIAAALILSLPVAVGSAQINQFAMRDMEQRIAAQLASGAAMTQDAGGDLMSDLPRLPGAGAQGADGQGAGPAQPVAVSVWQEISDIVFGRYFMMLAWCALYLALLTGEKARAAERREGAYRRAAKAAELRSLRYQVNPHFLFNTLNSLSALVLTGKTQAAERMIQQLSTFYRRSLADDPTADVPLREEFALQRLYLDIEAVRFPHRLRATYDLPPALEDARVPGMILQPLVENSVKHAVAPTSGRVHIALAAREEYGRLVLTVSDDGDGAAPERVRAGHGIGLANVRERLEARFGAAAGIVSDSAPTGYSTELRLPILRGETE